VTPDVLLENWVGALPPRWSIQWDVEPGTDGWIVQHVKLEAWKYQKLTGNNVREDIAGEFDMMGVGKNFGNAHAPIEFWEVWSVTVDPEGVVYILGQGMKTGDLDYHNDTWGLGLQVPMPDASVYYEDITEAWAKFVTEDPQINAQVVGTSGGLNSTFAKPASWNDADADVYRWYNYKQDYGQVITIQGG
jgi:hypothetical protein